MAEEYIEREAVCYQLAKQATIDGQPRAIRRAAKIVADFPAADVAPVVHAHWEQKEVFEAMGHVDELQSAFCPVCKRYHTTPYSYYFTDYHYCPNCGAKMDKDGDGE